MTKADQGESVQEWVEGRVAAAQERADRISEARAARRGGPVEVPEKSYELPAAGEYGGNIGGAFRSIKVGNDRKYRTTDGAEQAFLESLGYQGTLTRSGAKAEKEQAAEAASNEEA